jgi:hypothetical protein
MATMRLCHFMADMHTLNVSSMNKLFAKVKGNNNETQQLQCATRNICDMNVGLEPNYLLFYQINSYTYVTAVSVV